MTGGLGFIGSNVARRLVELGADVLVVDSLKPDYGGNLHNVAGIQDQIDIHVATVTDQALMSRLVEGQHYIFHLAGQVSHLGSMQKPFEDLEANCQTTLSLLEACRKHNPHVKLVYASTRQIYGVPDVLPVDERHALHPLDVNGIHKLAAEWYHRVYCRTHGLCAAMLRLTNTYGPRMRVKDARQTFLGLWIRQVLEGREIQVYGDGNQRRDLTYVDDAVDALLLAAVNETCAGDIFNVGGDGPICLRELAELLIAINGGGRYRLVPFPPEHRAIDIGDYYADDQKIRAQLGWRMKTPLREGLVKTLAYYRANDRHYWDTSQELVAAATTTPPDRSATPSPLQS